MEDPSVLEQFRSTLADYKRSGFDRGHLVRGGYRRQFMPPHHHTISALRRIRDESGSLLLSCASSHDHLLRKMHPTYGVAVSVKL